MDDDERTQDSNEYTFAQARELAGVGQKQLVEWAHQGRFAVIVRDMQYQIPVAIDRPTFDQWLHERAQNLAQVLQAPPPRSMRVQLRETRDVQDVHT